MVFLEEEDHRREGRVVSLRTGFRELSGRRRMKVIKEIHERFERFFYQEENFNFSPFRRKLKFHIFSCLKFHKFKFFIKNIQTMNFRLKKFKFSDKFFPQLKLSIQTHSYLVFGSGISKFQGI